MYKNYATFIGGFYNPELANKIANENQYKSSDKDFEESWKNVIDNEEIEEKAGKQLHRRRRVINNG